MIVFRGELTGNTKKFLLNMLAKSMIISLLIVDIIFAVPVIIFSLTAFKPTIIFLFMLPATWLFMIPIYTKSGQGSIFPSCITIDPEEKTIVIERAAGKEYEEFKMLDDIERIDDHGEFYHVVFSQAISPKAFVMQKDLLEIGTIEELETLFNEKINPITK